MRLSWSARVLTSCAALLLCVGFFVKWGDKFQRDLSDITLVSGNATDSENNRDGYGWKYTGLRDAENYGLSHTQCRAAFPKLFDEIRKSVLARKGKRIKYEELNSRRLVDGMGRAVVFNGELYVLNFESMKYTFTRAKATLSSLHRALTAIPDRNELPNIDFIFSSDDFTHGPGPIWTYSKREEDIWAWLMPDFGYWSWPEANISSYHQVQRQMAAIDDELKFDDKLPKLFWRGNVATAPELRQRLVDVTRDKPWASVVAIDWNNRDSMRDDFVPIQDHCRYMFLGHVEGRSYSGRGKYLLNCRSVFVTHKLEWREAHHAALVASGPDANYVQVKRDFSDLEEKMAHLMDHPNVARRIAQNSVEVFRDRYLTPAAEACHWRELILAYGKMCDFEPTMHNIDHQGKRISRGVPFESWILDGKLE